MFDERDQALASISEISRQTAKARSRDERRWSARAVQASVQERQFENEVEIESGAPASVSDIWGGAGSDDIVNERSQAGDDVGILADARGILGESRVAHIVTSVFDAPMRADALAKLSQGERFGLLFTDLVMPGMNGRRLAEAARAFHPDLPILFTSGYPENAIVHRGRLEKGVDLLTKPYRREDLVE